MGILLVGVAAFILTVFAVIDTGDFKKHGPRSLWFLFMAILVTGFYAGTLAEI